MLDPVLSEIVKNALLMVAQEAGIRAARSAGSTFVSQSAEVACALYDAQGRVIAQTEVGQMHISALRAMLGAVREDHPAETLEDGDVLITNDPFRGGIHPTDVGAFRPIFHEGKVVFYCGVMMIVSDLGGVSAGGLPANATECFHEGLMIPPVKLYRAGELDTQLARMIRGNSRTPGKLAADIDALAAGGNIAALRMAELIAKHGFDRLMGIIEELMDYTERLVRMGIEAIPDGTYRGTYTVESDGVDPDRTYDVVTTITIAGSGCRVDFTGTAGLAKGPINSSYSQSLSCVLFVMRCFLDPDIPMNEGFYRPIDAFFPPASLVNAAYPSACNLRLAAGQGIIDAMFRAMAQVYPEKTMAGSATVHTVNATGKLPEGDRMWAMLDVTMGTGGGRPGCDGVDGIPFIFFAGGGYDRNIESYEWQNPVRYRRFELLPDSAGPGEWRGGSGTIKELEFLTESQLTVRATDRCRRPPQGAAGGQPGSGFAWIVNAGQPDEASLPPKKTNHRVPAGTVLTMAVPGGGGFGDPFRRDPQKVAADVRAGLVTVEGARQSYGVAIASDGTIDRSATAALRGGHGA
ncbi:MAG TPA: hydantoinase B/oxoprolinase family protein [Alphaproteobacteria bacterium]|jgi:N-methylhydantoinase B|nr:hydantoinase B/oxoprolinase family protein [Alphaproteobacteria bacterium]